MKMSEMLNTFTAWSTDRISGAIIVSFATALIAAIGYVLRLGADWWSNRKQINTTRRAQLVQLQSLLRATRVSFAIQREHADSLYKSIEKRDARSLAGSLEGTFANAFKVGFPDNEREIHQLIRSITTNSLRPSNLALLMWLQEDIFFKGRHNRNEEYERLAEQLAKLQVHLLLWIAKYEMWIPERPEHALVYLADEERHGIEFPHELDQAVESVLRKM
jgi:hypothetical protein